MVSFCDIPLSQTIQHMDVYGSYGIGLSKEWGISNGVCPVHYTYPNSLIARKLRDLVEKISKVPGTSTESNELLEDFHDVSCYLKPYEGEIVRPDGDIKTVRFYDEREWRYVSQLSKESFRFGLAREGFQDHVVRQAANEHLWSQDRIKFKPNDIKFLIVESEREILELIKEVEDLKGKRYSLNEVKLLSSRIISADQIRRDL